MSHFRRKLDQLARRYKLDKLKEKKSLKQFSRVMSSGLLTQEQKEKGETSLFVSDNWEGVKDSLLEAGVPAEDLDGIESGEVSQEDKLEYATFC